MINLQRVYGRGAYVLVLLLLGGVSTGWAGQGTGTISGTIQDESGGVLPGVTVEARSPAAARAA